MKAIIWNRKILAISLAISVLFSNVMTSMANAGPASGFFFPAMIWFTIAAKTGSSYAGSNALDLIFKGIGSFWGISW